MISFATLGRRLGNVLYTGAFPLYRPLYGIYKGYADSVERALLQSRLSPGSVVVDAGANIGIYSQFLSRCVGPEGVVHSFEPSPDNFERLREGVDNLANVRLNQAAVSDRSGQSLLHLSDELNVDHRAYLTEGQTRRTVEIQATALDDYFKPGERVDLIKMDIQGYELHALRGATRVLADNPGVMLLMEFWPYGLEQAGTHAMDFNSFLRERGFSTFRPSRNGLSGFAIEIVKHPSPSDYINLFAERER